MWELKRGAVLIGLLFLLQGCGAKWHLNRAIAKDPTILDSVVLKVDTLIITQKEEFRDTLILQEIDTIRIIKEGIRIDLRRLYDTIEVDIECPADTIRIQKEIRVPQVIYEEKSFKKKHLIILIMSIILYTFGLIKLLK
jgi:hypothetical protein